MSGELIKYEPEAALATLRAHIIAEYGPRVGPVATLDELAEADAKLGRLKADMKALAEAKKLALAPVKALELDVRRYFGEAENAAADCEAGLKSVLMAFHAEQERRRLAQQAEMQRQADELAAKKRKELEEQAAAEAELFGGDAGQKTLQKAAAITPMKMCVPEVRISGSSFSTQKLRRIRVVDAEAIPRAFMTPDIKKITDHWKRTGQVVPGCEEYVEEVQRARAVRSAE